MYLPKKKASRKIRLLQKALRIKVNQKPFQKPHMCEKAKEAEIMMKLSGNSIRALTM